MVAGRSILEVTGSGVISSRVARGSTLSKDSLRSAFRLVHHSVQGCRPVHQALRVWTRGGPRAGPQRGWASMRHARQCYTPHVSLCQLPLPLTIALLLAG
jgi:hypothetical protein